MQDRAIVTIER